MIARLSDLCWVDLLVYLLVYPFARMPRQDEDFFFLNVRVVRKRDGYPFLICRLVYEVPKKTDLGE